MYMHTSYRVISRVMQLERRDVAMIKDEEY